MNENVVTAGIFQPRLARARLSLSVATALSVVALSGWVTFHGLSDEPYFADESAMIAQSYYYTLFRKGLWNHPDWLQYAAFDHPPLPKYLFGLSLDSAGLSVPENLDRWWAWMGYVRLGGRWQPGPSGGDYSPPQDPRVLYWARVPAAAFGVGGVLAAFCIGLAVHGRGAGLLAAILLSFNPLYLAHARRAMSDSFAECLVVAAVAVGLWGWKELWAPRYCWWRWLLFIVMESLVCGLAALAKLNGGVAVILVVGLLAFGGFLAWHRRSAGTAGSLRPDPRNLALGPMAAGAIGVGSLLVCLALNPFLTAQPHFGANASLIQRQLAAKRPFARLWYLVQFRRDWAEEAKRNTQFQQDWLVTLKDRLQMTFWEGFGRFSVLGPRDIRTVTVRGFDNNNDGKLSREELPAWMRLRFESMDSDHDGLVDDQELAQTLESSGTLWTYGRAAALVWFPLCLLGWGWAIGQGWRCCRSGKAPQPWALIWYSGAVTAMVLLMIPLNWDRYYLPIQPCSAVVASYGITATLAWAWSGLKRTVKPLGLGSR